MSSSSDVSPSPEAGRVFGGGPGDVSPMSVQHEAGEEYLEGRKICISYNSSDFSCEIP